MQGQSVKKSCLAPDFGFHEQESLSSRTHGHSGSRSNGFGAEGLCFLLQRQPDIDSQTWLLYMSPGETDFGFSPWSSREEVQRPGLQRLFLVSVLIHSCSLSLKDTVVPGSLPSPSLLSIPWFYCLWTSDYLSLCSSLRTLSLCVISTTSHWEPPSTSPAQTSNRSSQVPQFQQDTSIFSDFLPEAWKSKYTTKLIARTPKWPPLWSVL